MVSGTCLARAWHVPDTIRGLSVGEAAAAAVGAHAPHAVVDLNRTGSVCALQGFEGRPNGVELALDQYLITTMVIAALPNHLSKGLPQLSLGAFLGQRQCAQLI